MFKKFVTMILTICMFCSLTSTMAFAGTTNDDDESYEGYKLSWIKKDVNLLESVENDQTEANYSYDEDNQRTKKIVGQNITQYEYQDGLLARQMDNELTLEFLYNDDAYIGFNYQGNSYYYLKDNSAIIKEIKDASGNTVVKYSYADSGTLTDVLGLSDFGEWVSKVDDMTFIGNINPIVYDSHYLDRETGWYYVNGRYFDSQAEKFVNGIDNLDQIDTYEEFLKYNKIRNDSRATSANVGTLMLNAERWATQLLASSTYGKPMSHGTGWYNSLSDVEIVARLIFGEITNNPANQKGVSWTLLHRNAKSGFPNTLRGVATASGQFASITAASDVDTNQARNPSGSGWQNATYLACYLLTSSNHDDCKYFFGKDASLTYQYYFLSKSYFDANTRNENSTLKTAEYKIGGVWKPIKNIARNVGTGNIFFNFSDDVSF